MIYSIKRQTLDLYLKNKFRYEFNITGLTVGVIQRLEIDLADPTFHGPLNYTYIYPYKNAGLEYEEDRCCAIYLTDDEVYDLLELSEEDRVYLKLTSPNKIHTQILYHCDRVILS